jgi:hypothetical protein
MFLCGTLFEPPRAGTIAMTRIMVRRREKITPANVERRAYSVIATDMFVVPPRCHQRYHLRQGLRRIVTDD